MESVLGAPREPPTLLGILSFVLRTKFRHATVQSSRRTRKQGQEFMPRATTAAITTLLVTVAAITCAETPLRLPLQQRQLFLDDFIVAEMNGLTRVMHSPEKRGAVLKPQGPLDGEFIQSRSAPMWDPARQRWVMVYIACPLDHPEWIGPCLAFSEDGLHWTRPDLGMVDIGGSANNNRIQPGTDATWQHNALDGVIFDERDPDPAHRYKGLLGAEWREPIVSADCVNWRRLGDTRITSGDESEFVFDTIGNRFLAAVKTYSRYGRTFSITFSSDFEHWEPNRPLFSVDDEDQERALQVIEARLDAPGLEKPVFVDPAPPPEASRPYQPGGQPTWRAECYNIAVFPYEGLYIGLPMIYYPTGTSLPAANNTDGFDHIQLAVTRDLESWQRLGDRKPFIGPSAIDNGRAGVYDRMQLVPTNQPVLRNDELWFYYTGFKWRDSPYKVNHDGSPTDPATLTEAQRADRDEGWAAICLAVLRRDGFISLDAAEKGYVLTRPVLLDGTGLFLNVDASRGSVLVEVVDETGVALPGYALADCTAIHENALKTRTRWNSGKDLGDLPAGPVRLKFHIENASLYAFWTEQAPAA